MTYNNDKELNNLTLIQQNTIRQIDKLGSKPEKDNSYIELKNRLDKINNDIQVRRKQVLEELGKKLMLEEKNMPEETKTEEKKIGRAVRTNTLASAIEKVLLMKSITNLDSAVQKVVELMPNKDTAKVKSQINNITRAVTQGKQKRWQKYTWDKETFNLVEK